MHEKKSFLHGELNESIFIHFPLLASDVRSSIAKRMKTGRGGDGKLMLQRLYSENVQSRSDFMLKLKKSLCGLRQAHNQWNDR